CGPACCCCSESLRSPDMTPSLRILLAVAAVVIVGAGVAANSAPAQEASTAAWPTRPLRLGVRARARGGTDIAARLVAQALAEILAQPVVVENRAGAGGSTA